MTDSSNGISDLAYCLEHSLIGDPTGKAVETITRLGIGDSFTHGILRGRRNYHEAEQALAGPFEYPKLFEGDFLQGKDLAGNPILYPSRFRNEHTLTIATTGSGKTNLSRYEALLLAPQVPGMWLVDLRKAEYSVLQPIFERRGIKLEVVRARQMRINPLQVPKHVEPIGFASIVADSLVGVFELPPVATRLLFQTVLQLYRAFGVLEGGSHYPTLFDLRESLAANKQANKQARDATLVRLDSALLSLGPALAYRLGWSTNDLSKHHIVFDLHDCGEADQNLILNTLLIGEFQSRIAQGVSNQGLSLLIIIDEAGRVLKHADSSIGQMIGLIRGSGIGLDLSHQTGEIARSIISNCPNKRIGRCGAVNDLDAMASAIGLTVEQKRYLAQNLEPGLFLGNLGQGSWRKPFLFRVPLVRVPKNYEPPPELSPTLANLSAVHAAEFVDWLPDWARDVIVVPTKDPSPKSNAENDSVESVPVHLGLTDAERTVLQFLVSAGDPVPAADVPKQCRIGNRKAKAVRESLKASGCISEQQIQRTLRGRPAVYLVPTQKAKDLLGDRQSEGQK